MKKMQCKIHGEVYGIESDPILIRYTCNICKELDEQLSYKLDDVSIHFGGHIKDYEYEEN